MRRFVLAPALLALFAAAQAHAALVNDFELNGSTADSVGSATLTNNGGVLGPTGIAFAQNDGPSITNLAVSGVYTLDMVFSLTQDDPSYRYRKIFDFKNLTSDNGLYSFYGSLDFYPRADSPTTDFANNVPVQVTFSRDAAGTVTGYVNGVQKISYDDSPYQDAVIDSVLTLLTDDGRGGESSAGYVDYLRVYDAAYTPAELPGQNPGAGAVPEPASWAMMLGGFGLLGGAVRRRRPALRVTLG